MVVVFGLGDVATLRLTNLLWVVYSLSEVIALLLDHGARVTTRDIAGNTPLHIALSEGHEDIARLLIDTGANINAKNKDNERCVDLMKPSFRKEIAASAVKQAVTLGKP